LESTSHRNKIPAFDEPVFISHREVSRYNPEIQFFDKFNENVPESSRASLAGVKQF